LGVPIAKPTVYIIGGDNETISMLLRVIDRLRREYGINIYLETLGLDPWLGTGLPAGYDRIIVGDKEIDLHIASEETIIQEILHGIVSPSIGDEEIMIASSDHDSFSSGEYLLVDIGAF